MHDAIITVAKQPSAGDTKTRLCPPLSGEQAATLYEAFLKDTLAIIRRVENVRRVLAYAPAAARPYFENLAPDFELTAQQGDDLGARLDNATRHYLRQGCARVVIMDSDSPTLPAEYLRQAIIELERADSVLGACEDGGYYLIGLTRPAPRVLRDVQMSTPSVARDTMTLAAAHSLSMALLPQWYDIDTLADLRRLHTRLRLLPADCAAHTRAALSQLAPVITNP